MVDVQNCLCQEPPACLCTACLAAIPAGIYLLKAFVLQPDQIKKKLHAPTYLTKTFAFNIPVDEFSCCFEYLNTTIFDGFPTLQLSALRV